MDTEFLPGPEARSSQPGLLRLLPPAPSFYRACALCLDCPFPRAPPPAPSWFRLTFPELYGLRFLWGLIQTLCILLFLAPSALLQAAGLPVYTVFCPPQRAWYTVGT